MSILFDLDGTLIDTAPDFILAMNELRAHFGVAPLAPSALPSVQIAVSYGMDSLLKITNLNAPSTTLSQQLLMTYYKYLGYAAKPFPGIEALLNTLEQRKIPWGIVTNKEAWLTEPLLAKLGLDYRAACIVSGDTTPHFKPHPAPLLYACQQIGLKPQDCIYIGDAERDIIAGQTAGMTTIGALFGYIEDRYSAKQWGAHHYVQHADEILPWYEAWQASTRTV